VIQIDDELLDAFDDFKYPNEIGPGRRCART